MLRSEITGLVLAGGRGSRMGGVDKGLQPWNGRPLASWALERLSPQVGTLMISANRNLDIYRSFGAAVVADEADDFGGPLAGMLSALRSCATPYLATVPCDTPDFPLDLVARLAAVLESRGADIAIAAVTSPVGSRVQPVFSLFKSRLEPSLRKFVEQGGAKVREWMFQQACVEAEFSDHDAFANFNTLHDLQRVAPRG